MHSWTSPEQPKRRDHTWKAWPVPVNLPVCLSSSDRKTKCWRSFKLMATFWITEKLRAGTAASCSTQRRSTGWETKKGQRFTLLKRITRLKNVNSEIKSEDQGSYLERYSPKGSQHQGCRGVGRSGLILHLRSYITPHNYTSYCACMHAYATLYCTFSCTCTHTLAQNNHCEFWCGMHLTCKNTPITPDRIGLMNWLRKEPTKKPSP